MRGEPRAMRAGKPADSSTIQLTEEDYLVAIRPLGRGGEPLDDRGATARLLEERTLREELWADQPLRLDPGSVIRRALTLTSGRELPADSVHQGLRRLLDRGWVEYQASADADGERCWRLSDSGRQIHVS